MSDVAIIGAGIVGLATARALVARGHRVEVLEKERSPAAHQSSRNSGVLHTGVYYLPGSAKASSCREGYGRMLAFCRDEGLPLQLCGKVIVATREEELPALERIEGRGRDNGVAVRRIDPSELAELEPHARGVAALHVPEAGITSYGAVASRLASRLRESGAAVTLPARVVGASRQGDVWRLERADGEASRARVAVNCAGLHADRVARLFGVDPGVRIVPFRGEYYALAASARALCRGLIYPVPDPRFPFLGVHLTRTVEGGVECGPNAVLALAREGYDWSTVSARDALEALTYPGFVRLAARYWRTGLGEVWRSWSRAAFARALQRLVPAVRAGDLIAAPAGVRAQALDRDGALVDDFRFESGEASVHVINAPSPAATSSLAIAETVADRVESELLRLG